MTGSGTDGRIPARRYTRRMRVAIIGAGGLLGQDLVKVGKARNWDLVLPSRQELDITDEDSIEQFFSDARFDWVINCAAYVAVDDAEREQDKAYELNAHGAFLAAKGSLLSNARLLHYSTDYVFNGKKSIPYTEGDETEPLGVYAASKLAGERNVLATNPNSIIARTAWLYGIGRPNFPSKIYAAALDGKPLRLVADRVGSPTYTPDLAKATAQIMEANIAPGIYNVVNSGEASWYDLCKEMVEYAGIDTSLEPALNTDYPTPVERPIYSVLSGEKLQHAGIDALPTWQDAVRRFVDELRINGIPK